MPMYLGIVMIFQSTLPRRERHVRAKRHLMDYLFQSTLPRRERLGLATDKYVAIGISIHAPA